MQKTFLRKKIKNKRTLKKRMKGGAQQKMRRTETKKMPVYEPIDTEFINQQLQIDELIIFAEIRGNFYKLTDENISNLSIKLDEEEVRLVKVDGDFFEKKVIDDKPVAIIDMEEQPLVIVDFFIDSSITSGEETFNITKTKDSEKRYVKMIEIDPDDFTAYAEDYFKEAAFYDYDDAAAAQAAAEAAAQAAAEAAEADDPFSEADEEADPFKDEPQANKADNSETLEAAAAVYKKCALINGRLFEIFTNEVGYFLTIGEQNIAIQVIDSDMKVEEDGGGGGSNEEVSNEEGSNEEGRNEKVKLIIEPRNDGNNILYSLNKEEVKVYTGLLVGPNGEFIGHGNQILEKGQIKKFGKKKKDDFYSDFWVDRDGKVIDRDYNETDKIVIYEGEIGYLYNENRTPVTRGASGFGGSFVYTPSQPRLGTESGLGLASVFRQPASGFGTLGFSQHVTGTGPFSQPGPGAFSQPGTGAFSQPVTGTFSQPVTGAFTKFRNT